MSTLTTVTRVREFERAVWESDLDALDRLVALAFADHVTLSAIDGADVVFVAPERLRARTGMSERRARQAVRTLAERGFLVETAPARQHYCARYALAVPRQAGGAGLSDLRVAPPAALGPVDNEPRPAPRALRPAPPAARPARGASDSSSSFQFPTPPRVPDDVADTLRRVGGGEVIEEVWALAQADRSTTASAAGRVTKSDDYARQLVGVAQRQRYDALPPCPEHGRSGKHGSCSGCSSDHKAGSHGGERSSACADCHDPREAAA